VIRIYLDDVVPGQARPEKAAERAERLLKFFGGRALSEVTGALCREYVVVREGEGHSNKGKGGGAKRDLEDLRAAINHHAGEGLHRGNVCVVLPLGPPNRHCADRAARPPDHLALRGRAVSDGTGRNMPPTPPPLSAKRRDRRGFPRPFLGKWRTVLLAKQSA
jgi:hypothetical protein